MRAVPGRPDAPAGALREGTDPHPRRPARRRFACPIWAELNDEDLRRDLREVTREIRPDWDLSAPGLRAAWDAGDHARHDPYRQVDHTRGPAETLSDADRNTTARSE